MRHNNSNWHRLLFCDNNTRPISTTSLVVGHLYTQYSDYDCVTTFYYACLYDDNIIQQWRAECFYNFYFLDDFLSDYSVRCGRTSQYYRYGQWWSWHLRFIRIPKMKLYNTRWQNWTGVGRRREIVRTIGFQDVCENREKRKRCRAAAADGRHETVPAAACLRVLLRRFPRGDARLVGRPETETVPCPLARAGAQSDAHGSLLAGVAHRQRGDHTEPGELQEGHQEDTHHARARHRRAVRIPDVCRHGRHHRVPGPPALAVRRPCH